jgi:hypothetical protein
MAGRLTRFLNLEKKRPSREQPAHEVMTPGRFKPEPEMQLSPDHGEQPFLRCPACEADNGRFAERCLNCGARLDTEAVHAFNQQLWEQRRAEASAVQAAEVEHQKSLAVDRQALGGSTTPLGMRWLASLDEGRRTPAALGAIAVFLVSVLVALVATRHPLLRVAGGGIAVLLLSLFLPNHRRRFWD